MADFLTTINNSKYNYGTTPNFPVAEQNQTYFAYWNGIGGTGPEYMNGTGYFIKYLIDINGNVINPEPYTETTSIDAVALHNLKANFEVGKRAIVKLIEPDPTQAAAPSANTLKGTHRIAHVGRIVPILVTETGENKQDFITTMSFGPTSTQTVITTTFPDTPPVANVTAQFQYDGGEYTIPGSFGATIYNYPLLSNSAWVSVNDSTKKILSSSLQTGTRIRFKIAMYIEETWNANSGFNFADAMIYKNGEQLGTYRELKKNGVYQINDGGGGVYETDWTTYFDYEADDEFEVKVEAWDDGNSRELKVKGVADGRAQTVWYIEQETPSSITAATTTVALITNVNMVTSSYFTRLENNPNPDNGGYSILTLTPELTNMYNTGYPQNTDPASITFGFSPITIPFNDLKPGDFIRFEYRKNQTYTIFGVDRNSRNIAGDGTSDVKSVIDLYLTPSLSDNSITYNGAASLNNFNLELDHFQIYRVLDDGLYITLDVTPDWGPGGNAYTGLLIPEFISDELSNKLETLIQDLTQKEIIQ